MMSMATIVSSYATKLQNWISPYFVKRSVINTTKRCSIRITNNELTLLHLDLVGDHADILVQQTIKFDSLTHLGMILESWSIRYDLLETPIDWLLDPADYQLFLIESLPVPANEIRDALSWRVRSLINYPIEDALFDYFMLPPKKTSPNSPFVVAVVANINHLFETLDIFKKAHLNMHSIYIPELALRNLTELYENDDKSTAILYFYHGMILLTITRNKQIYFTRQLHIDMNKTLTNVEYEQISLDVLRYFDYFQTAWRHPTPSRIFYAADELTQSGLIENLSQRLLIPIQPYTLPTNTLSTSSSNTLSPAYLLNFGCCIQKDKVYATTGN